MIKHLSIMFPASGGEITSETFTFLSHGTSRDWKTDLSIVKIN